MLSLLQLLRFIAAMLVLLFHLKLVDSGYKGVDIFFVISGFVMYYTLFRKTKPGVITFIFNRFTKIFFLYWVVLFLLYVLQLQKFDPSFFKIFFLVPGHYSRLGVSWSLSYELYFYVVTALVVYYTPGKYQLSTFIMLLVACGIVTFTNLTSYSFKGTIVNFLLGPNFWEFLLGIAAGAITFGYEIKNRLLIFTFCMVCLGALVIIFIPYLYSTSYIVYGLLSFMVVLSITAFEKNGNVNKYLSGVFNMLGDASYAIYLFGPIVTLLIPGETYFFKTLIIAVTILFSILFNRLIEIPVLKYSRSLFINKFASPVK